MNIRLQIYKILERGWGKMLLFSIINAIVFGIFLLIYVVCNKSNDIGTWNAMRLFVSSGGILDKTVPWTGGSIVLLIMECFGTVLFSGLIISVLTSIITSEVTAIKEGHIHYKLKNHVVLIGYDAIVPSIIAQLVKSTQYNGSKVVLQTCENIEEVRCTLLTKLSTAELKRVVLIHAPRQSVEELQLLNTIHARDIFIVGDRTQNDHDAENMHTFEVLVNIHKKRNAKTTKPLMMWFENEASYAALQLNDISAEWKEYFEFRPYNFYKRWANRLLISSNYGLGDNRIIYPKFDHNGITTDSKKHIHLIIIGMNRMGVALAKEAAHLLHFPNFDEATGANRTRITFVDDHADIEKDFFMGRLPGYFQIASTLYTDLMEGKTHEENKFNNFLDIQFEFVKGRVESPQVREWIKEQLNDDDAIVSIAICIENPSQSFGMAMYLPDEVYTRGRNQVGKPWEVEDEDEDKIVNIFVRQETTGSLIKSFGDAAKSNSAANKRYANIYPFGMIDESFSLNYYSNHLAMAFNYIYDYYFKNDKTLPSSLPSLNELTTIWKRIPISHQWSNLYLADSIEFKLRSIGLNHDSVQQATISQSQIEELAETEHSRWNMEKLLLGYRALTAEEETLNDEEKEQLKNEMFVHHLIKPYAKLTDADKECDRNIIKMLPTIFRWLNS